jgi:hypothetical protein
VIEESPPVIVVSDEASNGSSCEAAGETRRLLWKVGGRRTFEPVNHAQ